MTIQDPTIIVSINGITLVAVGEPGNMVIQSDNKEYVATVKKHMFRRSHVPLIPGKPHVEYPTGDRTFLEVVAAMVAVDVGTAMIIKAPQEVWETLNAYN